MIPQLWNEVYLIRPHIVPSFSYLDIDPVTNVCILSLYSKVMFYWDFSVDRDGFQGIKKFSACKWRHTGWFRMLGTFTIFSITDVIPNISWKCIPLSIWWSYIILKLHSRMLCLVPSKNFPAFCEDYIIVCNFCQHLLDL